MKICTKLRLNIYLLTIILFGFSCKLKQEIPTLTTSYQISVGDIIITNSGNKSVLLLDSEGHFKATLLDLNQNETPTGIAYNSTTKEILITVDGTADRVIAISTYSLAKRDFINDIGNLTGTLYGITQLTQGDIIISEGNTIERYNSSGTRVTTGAWPKTLMTTSTTLRALTNGNFLSCSTGTDLARIYDNTATQVFTTAVSGIAGTTDLYGCAVLSDGTIAIAWNGTTDTVQIRSSNLATVLASYSNITTTVLSNPRGIAQALNGNILVVDNTANHIAEITTSGTLVRTFGDAINTPIDIFVVPSY